MKDTKTHAVNFVVKGKDRRLTIESDNREWARDELTKEALRIISGEKPQKQFTYK